MAVNVENMFYVRETPWHGLGTRVNEVLNSKEALVAAGLDWHIFHMSTLFPAKELVLTWYSSTPMTVRGQSRQQSHRFGSYVRTH